MTLSQPRTPHSFSPSHDLENRIINSYPQPIAYSYRRLTEAESAAGAYGALLDTFECLLYFLVTVNLSVYFQEGTPSPQLNELLASKFKQGNWSTGELLQILRETTLFWRGNSESLPYPEITDWMFERSRKNKPTPTPIARKLDGLVTSRNRKWGHGRGRDDRRYIGLLPEDRPLLDEILESCGWLANCDLWLPKQVEPNGRLILADYLNGERRRRNIETNIEIGSDLAGAAICEVSVLLIDPERGKVLSLFPFSAYQFQPGGEALFFLVGFNLSSGVIKNVSYGAYHSGVQEYHPQTHGLLHLSLEKVLMGFVQNLPNKVAEVAPSDSSPDETALHLDLPSAWEEQRSHTTNFSGRALWLEKLTRFAETTGEGKYLVVVGPPGQGKSALLSQLALLFGINGVAPALKTEAESEPGGSHQRGVCLLHMVKSGKNPLRILQFLLWQARRKLGQPGNIAEFRGDLDSLRSELVKDLKELVAQYGQVLVIIDALDELQSVHEPVQFLPEHLPANVCVVLSCRADKALLTSLRVRLNGLKEWTLPPLSWEDFQLIAKQVLGEEQFAPLSQLAGFRSLFERSGGNALLLRSILDAIRDRLQEPGAELTTGRLLETLPNSIAAVFDDFCRQIASDDFGSDPSATQNGGLQMRLLQYLTIQAEPLSLNDLRELLIAEGEFAGSFEQVRNALARMSQYLLIVEGDRFLPFHERFAEYLRDNVLGRDGVARIHGVFCQWLSAFRLQRSQYRLRHHVFHLTERLRHLWFLGESHLCGELALNIDKLLASPEFLQAKIEAGLVFELVEDYIMARERFVNIGYTPSPDFTAWATFIEARIHVFSIRPHLFLQQTLNELPDSMIRQSIEAWFVEGGPQQTQTSSRRLRWMNRTSSNATDLPTRTLRAHEAGVLSLAVSPDGKILISGGSDNKVKAWEFGTGRLLWSREIPGEWPHYLAVSKDGVVVSCNDSSVTSWWLANGQPRPIQTGKMGSQPRPMALSAQGDVALYPDLATARGVIQVVFLDDDHASNLLLGDGHSIVSANLSRDGRLLITADKQGHLALRDIQTGGHLPLPDFGDNDSQIFKFDHAVLSPDGKMAAATTTDNDIYTWRIGAPSVEKLNATSPGIKSIAFSSQGNRIIAVEWDRVVRVWDVQSGRLVARFAHSGQVETCLSTDGGKSLICGNSDGTIDVWRIEERIPQGVTHQSPTSIQSASLSYDGREGAITSSNRQILLWTENTRDWDVLEDGLNGLDSAIISPDGLFVAGRARTGWRLWQRTEANLQWVEKAHGPQYVSAFTFSPDSQSLMLAVPKQGLSQISISTTEPQKFVELPFFASLPSEPISMSEAVLVSLEAQAEQQRIFATTRKGLFLWTNEGMDWETIHLPRLDRVRAVSSTGIGNFCVGSTTENTLAIWDLSSREILIEPEKNGDSILTATFTLDGRYLLTGGQQKLLQIWDVMTGTEIGCFPTRGIIFCCSVAAPGIFLVGDNTGQTYWLQWEPDEKT